MNKKVLLSIIVILLSIVRTFSQNGQCGDSLTWAFNSNTNMLTISGSGEMWDYEYRYDSYYPPWYSYLTQVNSIEIGNNVTSIGNFAFHYCQNLRTVSFGNNLNRIGEFAFESCSSLDSINIPDHITSIQMYAFYNCSNLISVSFGNGVRSIEAGTFSNCEKITRVNLTNNIIDIGAFAFKACRSLPSINIPKSVISIGEEAFEECSNLISITIPEGITNLGWRIFYKCEKLTSIVLPDSLKSIGSEVFAQCFNLTSINLPDSLIFIGKGAFNGCRNLISITIPNGITTISAVTFGNCHNLTSISIPTSVTRIENDAFNSCKHLPVIDIPNSVTYIGKAAFAGCESITHFTIPNSISIIEEATFSSCSNLSSITLPDSLTTIESRAFKRCVKLNTIDIPQSVTYIGSKAFHYTAWFDNQPGGIIYIHKIAYSYKGEMPENTSLIIQDGTLYISPYAFYGLWNLKSVYIPNSVINIESCAFGMCEQMTYATIGRNVAYIGNMAFVNCYKLTSLINLNPVPVRIDETVFQGVNIGNCTLKVPSASLSLYKNAPIWKNFRQIVKVGIETIDSSVVKIYPNPASTHIIIDCGNYSSINGYTITIVNSLGQTLYKSRINQQLTYIDLSSWTGNGLYFFQIIDSQNNIIENRKIVIQ